MPRARVPRHRRSTRPCASWGLLSGRSVEGNPAHVLVDPEWVVHRGERARPAFKPLAQTARDSHRNDAGRIREVHAVRVHELAGGLNGAPQLDRVQNLGGVKAAAVLSDRAADREESPSVGEPRDLHADHVRALKRGVHVPERAQAAEAGKVDSGGAELLRDVSRDIDPHHVEGNSLGPLPLQGRETVADLLVVHAEPVLEKIQVVALFLRGAQEIPVRHEHGAREVVRERNPAQGPGLVRRELGLARDAFDQARTVEEPDLIPELEISRAAAEYLRDPERAALRVEMAHRGSHLSHLEHLDVDLVLLLEVGRQRSEQVLVLELGLLPEPLRLRLDQGEVVSKALDQVGDLLRRHASAVDPGQILPVQNLRRECRDGAARVDERVVEVEHGARDLGVRGHELARLHLRGDIPLEDRIPEHLHENGRELRVLPLGEGLQVEVGELGEPDEEVRADGAAVVLDEIQVARGHAKALRQRGLGEPFALAQGAYSFAQVPDRPHEAILHDFDFYIKNSQNVIMLTSYFSNSYCVRILQLLTLTAWRHGALHKEWLSRSTRRRNLASSRS